MGKLLPAGSRLMFQMHYTPTGIATEDQTRMAFRWCDEVPETEVRLQAHNVIGARVHH